MAKMRIVLDTNLLISGIFWGGTPHEILKLWFENKFEVWATEDIISEYFRIIEKIAKGNTQVIREWKLLLAETLKICKTDLKLTICRDPKDNMFLECAASISAKYLVSGDDDLLVLKTIGNTSILRAAEFLEIISS
jgi:putative PIN family toxin of toxin-antitoxin system